jgi:hypothetical protein
VRVTRPDRVHLSIREAGKRIRRKK